MTTTFVWVGLVAVLLVALAVSTVLRFRHLKDSDYHEKRVD